MQACAFGVHDYDLFTNGMLFIRQYRGDAASMHDLRPLVQMFNYDTAIVLGTMAVGGRQTARMQDSRSLAIMLLLRHLRQVPEFLARQVCVWLSLSLSLSLSPPPLSPPRSLSRSARAHDVALVGSVVPAWANLQSLGIEVTEQGCWEAFCGTGRGSASAGFG